MRYGSYKALKKKYSSQDNSFSFLFLFFLFILGLIFYWKYKESKRLEHIEDINKLVPQIIPLNKQFNDIFWIKIRYLNKFKISSWELPAKKLKDQLNLIPFTKINLHSEQVKLISDFICSVENIDSLRKEFNQEFIKYSLSKHKSFFDNIEGRVLDNQQRTAILTNEDNNIIVAGAGSGKTTTIVGKVSFLLQFENVKPQEILLMSFTRKASEEMRNRIKQKMEIDIDVVTFHKLGLQIISDHTGKKPSIFDESKLTKLINSFISELNHNKTFSSKITLFFTQYLKPYKQENEFQNQGEYYQYIKNLNIKSFKQIPVSINGKKTLLRETCKSFEEVAIANYFFLNNINYEYEKKYEHETATESYSQYKPDFYLTDYGIYLEHFGIDRKGNVPAWFGGDDHARKSREYTDGMKWKRATHKMHGTKLIETFSYEQQEGILLPGLEIKLKEMGVQINPRSPEEVWQIINEVAEDEVSNFTQLLITFLSLLKSNNLTISEICQKNNQLISGFEKKRNELFIEIFSPVFDKYNSYLKSESEIDFSDMINHATEIVSNDHFNKKYKYVIIDEFQDISIGRYKLVKFILDKNPGSILYCVGDDWQSVFRFSGSDISLFTQFENYFGTTERLFIETTYRFNSNLINISSAFILKNPNQVFKKLKSTNDKSYIPLKILYSDSIYNDDTRPLIDSINAIMNEKHTVAGNLSILALGRYNHDIEFIKRDTSNFSVKWSNAKESYEIIFKNNPDLTIDFLTVHRAKGLEADYVILLNGSSGKYGFPSEQADDPVLNLLLTKADQFPNGEERRLFYVALTRCKNKVFLLANSKYKSKFINELEEFVNPTSSKKCPYCKTGNLIESSGTSKNGYGWNRLSCSNWNMGCDYIKWNN